MKLAHKLFVDTSFFIALMNSRDANHAKAITLQQQISQQLCKKITSEYILLELCDGLAKLNYRSFAISLIDLIERDNNFEIIPTSNEITQKHGNYLNPAPIKNGVSPIVLPLWLWKSLIWPAH